MFGNGIAMTYLQRRSRIQRGSVVGREKLGGKRSNLHFSRRPHIYAQFSGGLIRDCPLEAALCAALLRGTSEGNVLRARTAPCDVNQGRQQYVPNSWC